MFKKASSLLAPEHLLVLSSLFTSGINFIIYVIYPSLMGAGSLDLFIRDNYAGGFYLFGIASSVSIVTTKLISYHDIKSVTKYAQISTLIGGCVLLSLYQYIQSITALSCILAAVLLHANGFMLAVLIRLKKIRICATLQVVQPFLFLSGILLAISFELMWAYCYLISVAVAFVIFLRVLSKGDFYDLFSNKIVRRTTISLRSLLMLIVASMSFPLFFQLELFFVGEFTKVSLGEYTILQKMYSSVSVALFSGLLVYMYGESKQGFQWRKIFTLPLLSAFVVCCLAIVLSFLGKGVDIHLLFVTVITSYIFSVAMFITFAMNVDNATLNIKLLFVAMLVYSIMLFSIDIESALQMLLISLSFYGTYILLYYYVISSRRKASEC